MIPASRWTGIAVTILGAFLGISFTASNAFAGWLIMNGLSDPLPAGARQPVTNASQTLSFASPPPGYAGTFTISHADSTDGRIDTSAFLDSYHFNLNFLQSIGGFATAGLDPTGVNSMTFGSTQVIANCSPCTQAGSASLNFSTLALGYLPTGTLLLISDIDGPDFVSNLSAFIGSSQLTTPWLKEVKRFDGDGPQTNVPTHQPDPGPSDYPAYSVTNGVYQFPTSTRDTDTAVFWFYTTQNISLLDFDFGVDRNVPRGFQVFLAAPDVVIPEPPTALLASLGLVILGRARLRRKVT
jgi:hypothetical protein